jgi:hypothetical protein
MKRCFSFALFLVGCAQVMPDPTPPNKKPSTHDLGGPPHLGGDMAKPGDMAGGDPLDFSTAIDMNGGGASDFAVPGDQSSTCGPVVNEVLPGTKATGTEEFVELYNPCSFDIDLTNWSLVYRSKTNVNPPNGADSSPLFGWTSGTFYQNTYLVYGGSGFTGTTNGALKSGVAAEGAVGLRDGNGVLVDSVAWGSAGGGFAEGGVSAPLPPVVASPGKSLARTPNGIDTNNNAKDFQVASPPTPGASN